MTIRQLYNRYQELMDGYSDSYLLPDVQAREYRNQYYKARDQLKEALGNKVYMICETKVVFVDAFNNINYRNVIKD